MNKPIEDGGPAFPQWDGHAITSEPNYLGGGISVRDYFAAAALQALIATVQAKDCATQTPGQLQLKLASSSYSIADAMLSERTKQP